MRNSIIFYLFFIFLFVFSLNLSCMSSFDSFNNFDSFNFDDAKILESLKKDNTSKKRDVFIDIIYKKDDFWHEPVIINACGKNFESGEDLDSFFSIKKLGLNKHIINVSCYNEKENLKISDIKKCRIQPFNEPMYYVENNNLEQYSKSVPSDSNIDNLKSCDLDNNLVTSNNVAGGKKSIFLMEISSNTVRIMKKSNSKCVFSIKVDGDIDKIGAKIYFDSNLSVNKNFYGIEYVFLSYFNSIDNNYCVYLCDKDSKIIFKENIQEKICFYEVFTYGSCKLIALIFNKNAMLFDLNTGKKIEEICCEDKITNFSVNGCNKGIFFSANKYFKIINNKNKGCIYNFRDKIISGLIFSKYSVFSSITGNSCFINFLNIKLNKIIGSFKSSFGDTFSLHNNCINEKSKQLYCHTVDKMNKALKIYMIQGAFVEKVFDKDFSEPLCDVNIDLDRSEPVCVKLLTSGSKSFNFLAKKLKHEMTN